MTLLSSMLLPDHYVDPARSVVPESENSPNRRDDFRYIDIWNHRAPNATPSGGEGGEFDVVDSESDSDSSTSSLTSTFSVSDLSGDFVLTRNFRRLGISDTESYFLLTVVRYPVMFFSLT